MADNKTRIPVKLPSLAFMVCLLISIACWILVSFSKDYKMSYEYKLVCDNLPDGRKSVTASDTVLTLTFNQNGFRYLMISIKDLIKPKNKVTVYTFTNKELHEYLVTHNFGPELVDVSAPEVITFYLR